MVKSALIHWTLSSLPFSEGTRWSPLTIFSSPPLPPLVFSLCPFLSLYLSDHLQSQNDSLDHHTMHIYPGGADSIYDSAVFHPMRKKKQPSQILISHYRKWSPLLTSQADKIHILQVYALNSPWKMGQKILMTHVFHMGVYKCLSIGACKNVLVTLIIKKAVIFPFSSHKTLTVIVVYGNQPHITPICRDYPQCNMVCGKKKPRLHS